VPGEEGSLWLTFHLQPPGGGEEWSAPADASTLRRIPDPDALPRCAGEPHTAAGRHAEPASAETPAVLAEIRARVTTMTMAARDRGALVLPPLLVLGTSERVGSNWFSTPCGRSWTRTASRSASSPALITRCLLPARARHHHLR
jgi:hypothetical protein